MLTGLIRILKKKTAGIEAVELTLGVSTND
jgi:hypothetical protein